MKIATVTRENHFDVKDISELLVKELYSYNEILTDFKSMNEPYQLICRSYSHFLENIKQSNYKKPMQVKHDIINTLNSFLSSSQKYLDKVKRILIKTFPNEIPTPSHIIKRTKNKNIKEGEKIYLEITMKIYDSSFEYRLTYNMRNYCQHTGHQAFTILKNKNGINILLSKNEYLNDHLGIQNPLKKELVKMNIDDLDILNIFSKYMSDIKGMNNEFLNIMIKEKIADAIVAGYQILHKFPERKVYEEWVFIKDSSFDGENFNGDIISFNYVLANDLAKDNLRSFHSLV
ncbi:hypothetical protein IMX26_13910 [Clostridium sp. 'deep sea']|uniref:hypothetical protein n=1 Tax=Clostridium sp. 'deep sea' TaxID=2779445 RepID=UPI001896A19E|nr:hypothetical protein [Clostridium sp. 'deep sea']QOR34559.1 hypothetical protein IMX26_13910 [Clostridium sp. 'deep sea']